MGFDEAITGRLQRLFPTSRVIDNVHEVQPLEWDLLVTHKDPVNIPDHLFVVAVAEDATPRFGFAEKKLRTGLTVSVDYDGVSRASEFTIPGGLTHRIDQLVEQQLLPVARMLQWNLTLRPTFVLRPFLVTSDGGVLAGSFVRLGGKAECWCLPSYVDGPENWVAAALDVWHEQDAVRFPKRDWLRANEWMTSTERLLGERLEALESERGDLLAALAKEEQQIIVALQAARQEADATHRTLLTGQGNELVKAVSSALSACGFQIVDMDQIWPQNNRREDLRATVKGDRGWTAIIEVRGYEKGAALNDLVRLHGRFRTMFLQETGRLPIRSWYVVNQFIRQPPRERPAALASQARELDAYAEDGVLVIDTVELLKLRGAVETGIITAEAARDLLKEQTGRLELQRETARHASGVGSREKTSS